jgi:hypothetical protein
MPRIAPLIALLCAVALVLPAAASASSTQSMTFEARRDLLDPAVRPGALDEIGGLGVHSLRIVLYWRDVAPSADQRVKPAFDDTDPAGYAWGQYDALIDAAKARGWTVLLTVSGPVPRWATNGARDTVTRPQPTLFAHFMQAVGRHYGPRIDTWSIWNEPNQPQFLKPQYSTHGTALSPGVYRGLFLAAQQGLRDAGLTSARVLLGETSPRGNRRSNIVAPLAFLRGVLCLNSRYHRTASCAKLDVAGYAHHAYTTHAGPSFRPPSTDDVTIGALSRLTRALDRAGSAGALPRRLPIYLTEFGIQSVPDPIYGVSLQRQAEYRSISERIAYANPRVVSFSQYLLRDDLPKAGAPLIARYPGFESGLKTSAGTVKPAYAGFRLPLAVRRLGARVSLWGLVRPATGPTSATVEYLSGGRWRPLATVTTDARGAFTRSANYRAGRQWRLTWTGPDGTVFRSPATRAYR